MGPLARVRHVAPLRLALAVGFAAALIGSDVPSTPRNDLAQAWNRFNSTNQQAALLFNAQATGTIDYRVIVLLDQADHQWREVQSKRRSWLQSNTKKQEAK